ncbi:hypothetical protein N6G02_09270 [Cupriavidus gilardii]|uniref:hypothetical protein n=1 Tax=Cupriavidus gilardii TaxID=82541 RepID=UPI0021BEF5FD|nr:hypothetical protein [Cupriavidus gilardii]MCT9116312.1 hypothetical protein [Cupriavidus gilardii]
MDREQRERVLDRLDIGEQLDEVVVDIVKVLTTPSSKDKPVPGVAVRRLDDFTLEVTAHRVILRSAYSHILGEKKGQLLGKLGFHPVRDGSASEVLAFAIYFNEHGSGNIAGVPGQIDLGLAGLEDYESMELRRAFKLHAAGAVGAILERF